MSTAPNFLYGVVVRIAPLGPTVPMLRQCVLNVLQGLLLPILARASVLIALEMVTATKGLPFATSV